MRRLTLLIALLALLAPVGVRPFVARALQSASLEVTLDRNQVTVGDRIGVTLVLRLPVAAQPDFSGLDQQFGALDVLVIGLPEERPLSGGLKEVRVRYEVAAFLPGPAQVPPLTVPFTMPDGTGGSATSAPIPVTVQSVLPPGADAADVRDLKPQIELPFNAGVSARALIAVGVFVATVSLAAALAGWWMWRRRMRARVAPEVVAVASPAEVVARAELDRIGGLGLLDADDFKTFHSLLAACVRRYLSDRYGFPAFAMTTSELRARMEQQGVGRWQARLVAGLLSECDAVNYARYAPARARAESNLSMAYEIVEMTLEGAEPAALTS
jgi:hypothetical protein